MCGAPATEVHHVARHVEADELLVSLCSTCHRAITQAEAARARAARRIGSVLRNAALADQTPQRDERAARLRLVTNDAPLAGLVAQDQGGASPGGGVRRAARTAGANARRFERLWSDGDLGRRPAGSRNGTAI
jgi:hypothetical protein